MVSAETPRDNGLKKKNGADPKGEMMIHPRKLCAEANRAHMCMNIGGISVKLNWKLTNAREGEASESTCSRFMMPF